MNEKISVYYMGYSTTMLNYLLIEKNIEVVGVITQTYKYSETFYKICINSGCLFYSVGNQEELVELYNKLEEKDVIMYEFGIIVPAFICDNFRIINFHPGDLRNNRGANPISWSILIPELGACMSAYKISSKIDCGELIGEETVCLIRDDTLVTLKEKLEATIPKLLSKVKLYMSDENAHGTVTITDGIYRKRVLPEDYTIKLGMDTNDVICRKINSQKSYKGALIDYGGEWTYVKDYKLYDDELYIVINDTEVHVHNSTNK